LKGEKNKELNRVVYRYFISRLMLMLILQSLLSINPVDADSPELDSSIVCTICFDSPFLTEIEMNNTVFTQISMPECFSNAEVGEPSLPVYPARLLIPQGKQVKKIVVTHVAPVRVVYDFKNKPVAPVQKSVPFSVSYVFEFEKNESSYDLDAPVNKDVFEEGEIGFCRGYEILNVNLYPVVYTPKSGSVSYYPDMTVKVLLEDNSSKLQSKGSSLLRSNGNDVRFVESIIDNPEDLETNPVEPLDGGGGGGAPLEYTDGLCDPADSYDYVIITNNSLKDTTGYTYNWSDLIDHRQNYSGLSGTIVTVEEIDGCTDYWNATALYNDSQAHIREFCKDAYEDWETEYVLLGGDWDSSASNQIVPFRLFADRFESGTYDTMACDKYYSHLDGDWYYSTDGIWGGGRNSGVNDLYGELCVGRICVVDAETVSNAVYKIINYDTNSSLSDSWLSTVSFWGGDLGWSSTSKQYMEEIRLGTDTWRTFTGFEEWNSAHPSDQINTSERLYHADLGANYKTYFINSLEDDNASMVNHLDHSTYLTPFGLPNWQSRVNTKPFFGFTQGCLAGRFHSGFAGCEQMICRHEGRHAYALVLNTGYGYGNSGSTNGASQYINAYFWDYFFNNQSNNQENWQIGKAFLYAHDKMGSVINSNSASWCYAWYSAHLFGDPAQTLLRIGDDVNNAVSMSDENPSDSSTDVSINLSTINVTLTDADGDSFNWSIETSPDVGSSSADNDSNGSKSCNVSGLTYNTTYDWFVNATDGELWNNVSYSFTTRIQYIPDPPDNFSATSVNRTSIAVSWVIGNDADSTYIRYKQGASAPVDRSDGVFLYNGTGASTMVTDLSFGTQYSFKAWSWNQTDGCWSSFSSTDDATTDSNNVPSLSGVNPANESSGQELSLIWSVFVFDDDGDSFNWSIECNNSQSSNASGDFNGSKQLSVNGLVYNTTYKIWVNVTDGYDNNTVWYVFTTRVENEPAVPNNFSAVASGRFQIDLSWVVGDNADYTYVEWRSTGGLWNRSEGTLLYNETGTSVSQSGLFPGMTRYYRAWSWNATDNVWSGTSSFDSATTVSNTAPSIGTTNPTNGSTGQSLSLTWLVSIADGDGDAFNWSIECNNSQSSNADNDSNGSKSLSVNGLDYDKIYKVWVNVSDGYDTVSEWFIFSTCSPPVNYEPVFSEISPSNGTAGVSISLSSLSVTIKDPEGDLFNWSIETSPDVGSSSADNDSNGSKSCNVSGLSYSTTYYWYVSAVDVGSGDWINATYSFTTESAPPPPPPPGGGGGSPPPPSNDAPVADAGGPYTCVVGDSILFDGSGSNDTDGTIESYSWVFGDGGTGIGQTITHIYTDVGNYTVTLTVTDDDGDADYDTTTAFIVAPEESSEEVNESEDTSDSDNDTNASNGVIDDNEMLPEEVADVFEEDLQDNSTVDGVVIGNVTHYLVDFDGDGEEYVFYNVVSRRVSTVSRVDDDRLLIDDDNDGDTVFVYNESSPYYERIIVNRSINLIGEDKKTTVIDAEDKGSVVKIVVDGVKISGFTIRDAIPYYNRDNMGIKISSNYNTIYDNAIVSSYLGIRLVSYSSNNVISSNYISNHGGITFTEYNTNNIVSNNSICSNDGYGLYLWTGSSNNIFLNNNINFNYIGLFLSTPKSRNNTISNNSICSNRVDGIHFRLTNNNTVSNNTISGHDGNGIFLYYSGCSNNNISANNISKNHYGINLVSVHDNIIHDNNVIYSSKCNIRIENGHDNTITRNKVVDTDVGIYIYSDNNVVSENNVTENNHGIYLLSARNNLINENNITNNAEYGVFVDKKLLQYSYKNKIYHNNFVNNRKNAYDNGNVIGPKNIWYDAYPSGGNYWDDYKGKDRFHGPKQNRLGGDGIGDKSYRIGPFLFRNMDEYPLMNPYGVSINTNPAVQNNNEQYLNGLSSSQILKSVTFNS
jgi:parallel beta-helix repeat protein